MEGSTTGAAIETKGERTKIGLARTSNPERMRQHLHHLAIRRRMKDRTDQALRTTARAGESDFAAAPGTPAPKSPWIPGRGQNNAHVAHWHTRPGNERRGRIVTTIVLRCVARAYGVSVERIVSQDRHQETVRPRQVAMMIARTVGMQTTPEVGMAIGGRDHTTVLHGVRRISTMVETDAAMADVVARISFDVVCEWDAQRLALVSSLSAG